MAKKRQEEPPKGSPAWMATFSDLMNLLLSLIHISEPTRLVAASRMPSSA